MQKELKVFWVSEIRYTVILVYRLVHKLQINAYRMSESFGCLILLHLKLQSHRIEYPLRILYAYMVSHAVVF